MIYNICQRKKYRIHWIQVIRYDRVPTTNLKKKFTDFPWLFPWPGHKFPWPFSAFWEKFYLENEMIIATFLRWISQYIIILWYSSFQKKYPDLPWHFWRKKKFPNFPWPLYFSIISLTFQPSGNPVLRQTCQLKLQLTMLGKNVLSYGYGFFFF